MAVRCESPRLVRVSSRSLPFSLLQDLPFRDAAMFNFSQADWEKTLPFIGNVRLNHQSKEILYYQGADVRLCRRWRGVVTSDRAAVTSLSCFVLIPLPAPLPCFDRGQRVCRLQQNMEVARRATEELQEARGKACVVASGLLGARSEDQPTLSRWLAVLTGASSLHRCHWRARSSALLEAATPTTVCE